ncbi:MAG: hypothetical protein WCK11_00415 [Candidatus Falkowbacteria bacterium]
MDTTNLGSLVAKTQVGQAVYLTAFGNTVIDQLLGMYNFYWNWFYCPTGLLSTDRNVSTEN